MSAVPIAGTNRSSVDVPRRRPWLRAGAALLVAAAAAGCAGTVKARPWPSGFEAEVAQTATDEDIAAAFERPPRLPARLRLAVYAPDADKAARIANLLQARDDVSSVYRIPSALGGAESGTRRSTPMPVALRALRLLAARAGAETLVVADWNYRIDHRANGLAAFGVALVPLLFVPFQDVAVETRLELHVVDTRSGYLHGLASAAHGAEDEFLTIYSDRGLRLVEDDFVSLLGEAAAELDALFARARATPGPPVAVGAGFAPLADTTDPWPTRELVVALMPDGGIALGGTIFRDRADFLVGAGTLWGGAPNGTAASRRGDLRAVIFAPGAMPFQRVLEVARDLERLGVREVRYALGAAPAAAPLPAPKGPSYATPELQNPFASPR